MTKKGWAMLARGITREEVEALLRTGDWVTEPKLDGIRARWSVGELFTRGVEGIWHKFPEIKGLGDHALDGEIVPMHGSFETVAGRVAATGDYQNRATANPCRFVAFDAPNLALPLEARREHLEQLRDRDLTTASVIPQSSDPNFIQTAMNFGMEGVVLKHRDSRYKPGVRSPMWRKLKFTQTVAVVAYSYEPGKGSRSDIGAVKIGVYEARDKTTFFTQLGTVGSGFTARQLQDLKTVLDMDRPQAIEVKTLGRTTSGKLRQPTFHRFRSDLDPVDCTYREIAELPCY